MIEAFRQSFSRPASARRLFLTAAVVLGLLRILFAAWLPFTGDEAYFTVWGIRPDWGYYDHPPMIGWWLALLAPLSLEPFVLRLPALLVPLAVALIGVFSLRRFDQVIAWNAGTLILLAPLNVWNVAITTDIPLMLFAALGVAAYAHANRSGRSVDFLLAGVALAGALLSKYFATLLVAAVLLHALWRGGRARFPGVVWMLAGMLPAAVIQIWWNALNCWPNLMFNVVNRHDDAGWSWLTPVLYLLSVLYVLTPYVAWRLVRRPVGAAQPAPPSLAGMRAEARMLRWLALFPLAIFAILSPLRTIGLHWLAAFVFPAMLAFALTATTRQRMIAVVTAVLIAVAHWILIGALAALPTETFRNWRSYPGLVMTVHADEMAHALEPWRAAFTFAANGYSPAVTLGHALRRSVFVFGPGSSHARHDDIVTDLRKLDGRDILVVHKGELPELDMYRRYFERIRVVPLVVRGARFELIEGIGFRYADYRDEVLDVVRARWYAVPRWLPHGPCYFCDRYFPERSCHR